MFQHCSCSRKWVIISFIFQVIFSEDMKLKSWSLASLHVFSLWAVLPSIEGGTQVSYMSPPLNILYLSYHQMLLILPSKSFFYHICFIWYFEIFTSNTVSKVSSSFTWTIATDSQHGLYILLIYLWWSTKDLFSALSFQQ